MFEASVFLTFLSTYLTASTIWWKQLSIVFDDLVSFGKLEQIFDPFVMILRWQKFFWFFRCIFCSELLFLHLGKNGDRHCLANYFCHAKWCWSRAEQMGQVIWCWQGGAPAKESFFVKLTFAELSFCDGPGEEIFLDMENNS